MGVGVYGRGGARAGVGVPAKDSEGVLLVAMCILGRYKHAHEQMQPHTHAVTQQQQHQQIAG